MSDSRLKRIQRVRTLSDLLDSKFEGPWGIKYGLDGLLGLLPVFGDTATSLLSFYIIIEAALLGCPLPVLLRMILNVVLENVLDFVPFFGNVFDFFWKSNNKNFKLLLDWESDPKRIVRSSTISLFVIFVVFISSLSATLYAGYKILFWIYRSIFIQ